MATPDETCAPPPGPVADGELLRVLVDAVSDIIAVVDSGGVIRFLSASVGAIGGYAPGELVGRRMLELVHPDDRAAAETAFAELLRTGLPQRSVRRIRHRDGGWRTIEAQSRRVPAHDCVVMTLRDVSERALADQRLARANRALKALSAANAALVHADQEAGLLEQMCRVIVERAGYRMAWVGLAEDDAERTVRPVAAAGMHNGYLDHARISWGDNERGRGPTGRAIREGLPQVARDIGTDPAMAPWREDARRLGFASSLALPLRDERRVFGALMIYAREPDAFDAEELALLGEMAADLAYGWRALQVRTARAAAERQLERSMEATIRALAATVEKRDPYTAGHQRRTAELAVTIGRRLGLDERRLSGLRLAAIVHDVGKIQVPTEVLTRPGRIGEIEMALIRLHPQTGHEILKGIEFPWPVAEIVLQHHERLDGSGYPRHLRGEEILLEARILAVADVVEAMASHRPYRPAHPIAHALQEIGRQRGTALDAAVVDACVDLFVRQGYRLLE